MVLSLVALVVLLVAVVVAALCYHHRQRGKERRHLAVAYRAGQTDTSDYMVPGQPGVVLEMRPQPRCPSCTRLTPVPADVPPSHHAHYYSNPSYHTLSQCPLPAPGPQDRASSLKVWQGVARDSTVRHGAALPPPSGPTCPFSGLQVPGTQLFPSTERPYGPYSPEGNATLPPDWKHLGASALGPRGKEEWGAAPLWILARVGWIPESPPCSGSTGKGLGWGGWRTFILGGRQSRGDPKPALLTGGQLDRSYTYSHGLRKSDSKGGSGMGKG